MAIIHITDLKLRTIIGTYDWERENKQDIIINISMEFDASKAGQSDRIEDTINYKTITKKIIKEIEASSFFLIEKLAQMIMDIVMENILIREATVKVDKPFALRFADSVSIELEKKRPLNNAVIALGSNIDANVNIEKARQLLSERFKVISESRFVETEPVGITDQPNFLNGSVFIETDKGIDDLNKSLKNMEKKLGRKKSSKKFGPRSIDMDVVVWNNKIISEDVAERDFLKTSVLELIPGVQL